MIKRRLVVVAGLLGSGKSTIANRLTLEEGYDSRSVGDELARLYCLENGLSPDSPVPGLERMKTHKRIRQSDPSYFARFIIEEPYERRVIDGLRNYDDAIQAVKAGGYMVTLVAPRPFRLFRRLDTDLGKDPSLASLVTRELTELDDSDPAGSQALRVMALAHDHGIFIDASHPADVVYKETLRAIRVSNPA